MGWLFGKKPGKRERPRAIESAIPRDEDRAGPAPPPPRTAHAPGVAVYAFAEIPEQHLLRFGEGFGGFFLEGKEKKGAVSALLVLWTGAAATPAPLPGDVLLFPSLSLEEISRTSPPPRHHIKRDGLAGRGVSGITGLRTLHADAGLTVLRLGPPPGARWVLVGVRVFAVFAGMLTLVDGEEARDVPAGHLALVAEPSATLYLQAGNDSALAIALAAPGVVSALG